MDEQEAIQSSFVTHPSKKAILHRVLLLEEPAMYKLTIKEKKNELGRRKCFPREAYLRVPAFLKAAKRKVTR